MASIISSPPAVEPVSLATLKDHLRIDAAGEDELLSALIEAARSTVEAMSGVRMIAQGWKVVLDDWPPAGQVCLPLWPVLSVDAISVLSADDVAAAVDPAHWFLDSVSRPARIVLRPDRAWPRPGRIANGIEISLMAGFGADAASVPAPLRQAMLQLCAHWYENREAAGAGRIEIMPLGVPALLAGYRTVQL